MGALLDHATLYALNVVDDVIVPVPAQVGAVPVVISACRC